MKRITYGKLSSILKRHEFILLRMRSGSIVGMNCGIDKIARRKISYNPKKKTAFVSYKPCCINEYISHKVPFIL